MAHKEDVVALFRPRRVALSGHNSGLLPGWGGARVGGSVQAAAANSISQRSDADGAGKTARFGHPKHSYSVAIKRALALQNPEVLGTLAQLGSVQDARLSELLSAHLGTQLRTLVVESRECRCGSPKPHDWGLFFPGHHTSAFAIVTSSAVVGWR